MGTRRAARGLRACTQLWEVGAREAAVGPPDGPSCSQSTPGPGPGWVHRAPTMNGRPGGQRLSEGGPSHPCPPAPGLGLGVGWHSIPARALGGLWLPPSLLRLQGQARVYPGIPGPEVSPSSEGQGLGWLLPGWGQWAGATAEVSYAAEERGWITTRSGGDWEAVDGRPRPRSCSVCPGPGRSGTRIRLQRTEEHFWGDLGGCGGHKWR